ASVRRRAPNLCRSSSPMRHRLSTTRWIQGALSPSVAKITRAAAPIEAARASSPPAPRLSSSGCEASTRTRAVAVRLTEDEISVRPVTGYLVMIDEQGGAGRPQNISHRAVRARENQIHDIKGLASHCGKLTAIGDELVEDADASAWAKHAGRLPQTS